MKLNLAYINTNKTTFIYELYLPTIQLFKKSRPQIGGERTENNIEFNTKIALQTNKTMLNFEIVVLGFGIRIYLKEKDETKD